MATGTTTASDVSSILPTFLARALVASQEVGPMRNLVQNYEMQGGTLSLPEIGSLDVAALTEGVEIGSTQKLSTSAVTLTSGKYGGKALLTDEAINRAKAGNYDLANEVAVAFGTSYGNTIDEALVDLFSGFSVGCGTAGTELTVAEFGKAPAKLKVAKAPAPYVCVLHPYQAYNLFKDLKVPDSSKGFPANFDNVLRPFFESSLFNIPVFTDFNIDIDGSDDAYGAMFNPMALALGIENEMVVEQERVPGVGWNIVAWGRFAVVERKDAYGVYMLYDSAL